MKSRLVASFGGVADRESKHHVKRRRGYEAPRHPSGGLTGCKTRENSNFLKNGKIVISVKIRNFSRSRMTKRTSPLESSRKI